MNERAKQSGFLETFLWSCAFALYPVIFLWSKNWEDVFQKELCIIFLSIFILNAIIHTLCKIWIKDSKKTTLLSTFFFFMFFSFGHIFDYNSSFFKFLKETIIIWNYNLLIPLWVIFFIIGTCIIKKMSKEKVNLLFTIQKIVTTVLLGSSLFTLMHFAFVKQSIQEKSLISSYSDDPSIKKPNIYYIILDEYGREDILKEIYDLNISNFTHFLKSKNFFIADKSCSNYSITMLSIPSSLKMDYLDIIPTDRSKTMNNCLYSCSSEIENSQLFYFLKQNDYKVFNISNDMTFTAHIKKADQNFHSSLISPFTLHLVDTTFLGPILRKINFFQLFNCNAFNITLNQLELLKNSASLSSPHLVLCHILCPHPPFVFNENGSIIHTHFDTEDTNNKNLYKNQLIFLNKKVEKTIEELLSKDPESIIILQGDHGPCYSDAKYFDQGGIGNSKNSLIKERMSILNAYHFPAGNQPELTSDITPINSFRVILNHYLGISLPILSNTCYWSSGPYYLNFKEYAPEEINEIQLN